jgi:hypothetical protein
MLRRTMAHRLQRIAATALCLLAGACASVRGLDEAPTPLSASEQARVARQVDSALEERKWDAAWNQAVEAGAERARLEDVALRALADDDGVAGDMFEALVAKWGGLTTPARERVSVLVGDAIARRDWERAVELELLTAEDAPAYAAAWGVYDQAPAGEAEPVLAAIVEARADRERSD